MWRWKRQKHPETKDSPPDIADIIPMIHIEKIMLSDRAERPPKPPSPISDGQSITDSFSINFDDADIANDIINKHK